MMAVVAVTAILFWLARISPAFLAMLDDTFDSATSSFTTRWDAGAAPTIEVDIYGGYISVVQSTDGRVSAVITTSAIVKNSQAGADAAVDGVVLTTDHLGDTIRIRATNPRNPPAFSLTTDVALRVPPGARLDLVTGHGYIHIGQCLPGPNGGRWMSSPVALKSVKARDLGGVFTGMEVEILSDPSSPATVLDLESRRGSIRIKGDNLLIKAKADAGGVEYHGRPAPGFHSFVTGPFADHADAGWRLERGIRLVVPGDMGFELDAASARDQVRSEFPFTVASPRKLGVLSGAVGTDPKVKIELRSDDGPIEILQQAPGTQNQQLINPDERTGRTGVGADRRARDDAGSGNG
jgi:hypothetical protein